MSSKAERLVEIVADAVGVSPERVDSTASSESIDSWDSVAQLSIMLAIESEFGVRLPVERIAELASIQALLHAVESERE